MLPTKDDSDIGIDSNSSMFYKHPMTICQHLYITSPTEPKVGDWVYDGYDMLVYQLENCAAINKHQRKIIATTDKKLTVVYEGKEKYKGRKIDAWVYLPQIPKEFLKEYCDKDGISDVMVEYREELRCYKCGKLEDDCINTSPNCLGFFEDIGSVKLASNDTIIITASEEKKYSKEEVNQMLYDLSSCFGWDDKDVEEQVEYFKVKVKELRANLSLKN